MVAGHPEHTSEFCELQKQTAVRTPEGVEYDIDDERMEAAGPLSERPGASDLVGVGLHDQCHVPVRQAVVGAFPGEISPPAEVLGTFRW
jgi:hypothetical protein